MISEKFVRQVKGIQYFVMGKHNFKVVEPDATALKTAGYGRVAHLPFILDSSPGYHRDGSEYLIDRGLGVWSHGKQGTRGTPPSAKSIRSYAAWLCNFLEWAETRGVDLATADYVDHVHGRYQFELMSGLWGKTANGLHPTTVNLYVDTATDFLEWMATKGKRAKFEVPRATRTVREGLTQSSTAHRTRTVEVRKGRVRQAPRILRMPENAEVERWLSSVYERKGETFGLMCEVVLMTAVRREEVCCWRLDTLPLDPSQWVIANPAADIESQVVIVSIRYGAKGPDFGIDHGNKIGPLRKIKIPLHLAKKIHHYRQKIRPMLLLQWVAKVRGAEAQRKRRDDAVHLFLNPDGLPEDASRFYAAWKSGDLPFPEWSPHLGRHWWACSTLLQEINANSAWVQSQPAKPGALTAAVLSDVIRLKIVPQLGHISSDTTNLYLQWVADNLDSALPELYQAAMLDEKDLEQ